MSKYGVWATRGASSIFGAAQTWSKDLDGEFLVLDTQEEAQQIADRYNKSHSPLADIHYYARELEPELAMETLRRRAELEQQPPAPEMEMGSP